MFFFFEFFVIYSLFVILQLFKKRRHDPRWWQRVCCCYIQYICFYYVFSIKLPKLVRSKDYENKNLPVLFFIHGGGWCHNFEVLYMPAYHDLIKNTNVCVCYINYRMAPEYKHPIPIDDCEKCIKVCSIACLLMFSTFISILRNIILFQNYLISSVTLPVAWLLQTLWIASQSSDMNINWEFKYFHDYRNNIE